MKWIDPSSLSQEPLTLELVLDNLLINMPTHLYWKNKAGIYLGCNDAQAKSLGLKSAEEVIGKTDFDLPWDKELAKRFFENDLAVLQSGEPNSLEESTLINGTPATVISLKIPMKDRKGHICGILGISMDVTAQKRIEKSLTEAKEALEIANHTKQEFLENMRHDIRTPLTGIVGCAEIIKNIATEPKVQEYAEHLVTSSQSLSRLLNEVLECIKVGSQHYPLLKKPFCLEDLVTRMIALNQAKAAQKNVQFTSHYDPQIPAHLIGDPMRIERILLELITNALNFTQQGEVSVTAELAKHSGRDVIIKLIVQDTGIGIPSDKQREVFTRFKRMTPSCQGIYPGAGLGLSIIKELIDDLEGELYFQSKEGEGSQFTCILCLKKSLLSHPYSAHSAAPLTQATPSSFSILLVEDSHIAATVAKKLLTRLGHKVEVAENGQSALDKLKQGQFDLILLDIGLPDISGIEVAKQIRKWETENNVSMRIIALTAHIDTDNAQECLKAGIDEVINKPLTESQAKTILSNLSKKPSDFQVISK